jgi:hypothetical protein
LPLGDLLTLKNKYTVAIAPTEMA